MLLVMTENTSPPVAPAESRARTAASTGADSLDGLVEAARNGDQRAFERIYRQTVDAVYGLCLRMTANPSLAEDCVQQTYLQAWRNLRRFRGDSALSTWLHRIAVNEVRGHFRKEARHDVDASDEEASSPMTALADFPITARWPAN